MKIYSIKEEARVWRLDLKPAHSAEGLDESKPRFLAMKRLALPVMGKAACWSPNRHESVHPAEGLDELKPRLSAMKRHARPVMEQVGHWSQ